MTAVSGNINYL